MSEAVTFIFGGAYVGNKIRNIPHSGNARLHWRSRAAWNKAWKDQTALLAMCQPTASDGDDQAKPLSRAAVTITLRTIRPLDVDNAYAAVKPIVDGLKGVLIVDDSPEHIELLVKQVKVCRRADERVEVTVCTKEDPAAEILTGKERPEQEKVTPLI